MQLKERLSEKHGSVYPPSDYLLTDLPVIPISIGSDRVTDHTYRNNLLFRIPQSCLIFQYTIAGLGELKMNGRSFKLYPGTAFLVDTPINFQYYQPPDSEAWHFIYISFFGAGALSCGKKIMERRGYLLNLPETSMPVKMLVRMLETWRENGFPDLYTASLCGYHFLMSLLRMEFPFHEQEQCSIPVNLARAADYIRKHLKDRTLTIQDMARKADLSRFYFSRLFKKYYGVSPGEYLLSQRLNHAADLLSYSQNVCIKNILEESGFSSESYFCRAFRRHFGMTLGNYRRRLAYRRNLK